MSFKLLCIDLDGTLLNHRKEISAATIECLRLAERRGVHIAICTGRKQIEARYYTDLIGLNAPLFVTVNGALITAKDCSETIALNPLDPGLAWRIHLLCHQYHLFHCFHTIRKEYCGNAYLKIILRPTSRYYELSPARAQVTKEKLHFRRQWRRLFDTETEPFLKCTAFCSAAPKLRQLRRELLDAGELEIVSSGSNNVEITRKGANKGSGVATLARHLGLRPDEIIAIGDNENDLGMIEYAGLGVAMGNAAAILQQKADTVTATNEQDGVAQVIRKYIF
jgi:Cof subfamily protein (haloacid dehalogenase superfamily)